MSKTKKDTAPESAPAEVMPPPGPADDLMAATNDADAKAALGRIVVEGDPARLEAIGGPAVVASLWDGILLGCTVVDGVARVEIAPYDG